MTSASVPSARVMEARARLSAFVERMMLESIAADYQRGRDPSSNLKQLLELQTLKRRLGLLPGKSD